VTDPERSQPSDVESLRHLHGLTRAEARIAMLLTSGLSFADVIEMLGITANTGRGHLKNIFSKTETRTQAQLVRLLLSIPVVRPPADVAGAGLVQQRCTGDGIVRPRQMEDLRDLLPAFTRHGRGVRTVF
jgi:DNA-binding CsgD family transcriptional regulator